MDPPPRSFAPSAQIHFRPPPVVPMQPSPSQQFIPMPASQQFQAPPFKNPGFPPPPPQLVVPTPRPGQPPPPHQFRVMPAGMPLPQPIIQPQNNFHFHQPPFGQSQVTALCQSGPHMNAPLSITPQPEFSIGHGNARVQPLQPPNEQAQVPIPADRAAEVQAKPSEEAVKDWIEHTSPNGRKYYFNKRTRQSTWEKPVDLLKPIERADATSDWKEFTSADGQKFYYNKVTKQSKWTIPIELKLARQQFFKKPSSGRTISEISAISQSPVSVHTSTVEAPTSADASTSSVQEVASSPVKAESVVPPDNPPPMMVSGSSSSPAVTALSTKADEVQFTTDTVGTPSGVPESDGLAVLVVNDVTSPRNDSGTHPVQENARIQNGTPVEDVNETRNDVAEKSGNSLDKKGLEQETLVYANKEEAKIAFKALLESANVASDWTWDQAMRAIINDRRYGALKSLGERKQVFNEFIVQKKKQDAEERWTKQKKAREDFRKMLEECKELTSTSKLSKALVIFENDERFKAVEREKDRRDLFDDYLDELEKRERARAQEERKRNLLEYRHFLESCDFIKTNTQWRKVQDRLEGDERCSRLEKMDRLDIFQEYLNDLERDEEERRKLRKEEMRKAERKNRDDFRKLMEEHVADGTLTAKTHWLDYTVKVKDEPAYLAVTSNTSGSTPKDLFEDVTEVLLKQYHEDKARIKDAVKLREVALSSSWTFEDLKAAIAEDVCRPSISDINLKFVFEELLERAREKEEKEAKKRKRLSDQFYDLLRSIKVALEITSSSNWLDCKQLFDNSPEYSDVGDEHTCKEIFEEYVTHLKDKEYERKRKDDKAKKERERDEKYTRKRKHGRDRDLGFDKDSENPENIPEDYENRRSEKDGNRKHRRRHRSSSEALDEIIK
ncbi:LOW QUALITY PROTEIN: pre-mRNA-processing protein 40B-like [Rutidosis leptorrhynchoides]|uniref:LOW QUALITY PROTEIN: pre-mRNA-processing protein 40B-like n=1 Tax=Rutidosis leptorrhynchoides TaxID=125765 RepID=UPI003A99BD0D